MSYYAGAQTEADVTLCSLNLKEIQAANFGIEDDLSWMQWRRRASKEQNILYFSVYGHDRVVGEIFLHDMNANPGEALLGYRIFSSSDGGKGYSSKALRTLIDMVKRDLNLQILTIITGETNKASRYLAERCGFKLVGPSAEDPHLVVYSLNLDQSQ